MAEPWMSKLAERDSGAAWDLFIARYRRLIVATIRRLALAPEDTREVFAHVCSALGAGDLARLRRYAADSPRAAAAGRFSTWLVVVVRNQAIDWLRHRDGRRRAAAAPALTRALTSLQRGIFEHEVLDGRARIEAYELLCGGREPTVPFGAYLKEVRATYRALDAAHWHAAARDAPPARGVVEAATADATLMDAESRAHVASLLRALAPDVRLAVQLFVVEGVPAADVARLVAWPSAKTVYNRVHRALAELRAGLERRGVGRADA